MAALPGKNRRSYTYDAALQLKSAGAITADGACQVGGAARVIDVGNGCVEGHIVVDFTAIEAGAGKGVSVIVQGSPDADFGTSGNIEELNVLRVGDPAAMSGGKASDIGRYILPFSNVRNNRYYRYIRLYADVAGTLTTGFDFSAYIAKE